MGTEAETGLTGLHLLSLTPNAKPAAVPSQSLLFMHSAEAEDERRQEAHNDLNSG